MSDKILKAVVDRVAFLEKENEQLYKIINVLREKIAAWPEQYHIGLCQLIQPNGTVLPCNCGVGAINAARAAARKATGLED